MIADFSRLGVLGGSKHLIKNGTVLLLVSLSLHLRSGRVEEVHAWINNPLQLSTISELLSGLATCSFLVIIWLWLPWSDEPKTNRLAKTRLIPAQHTQGQAELQLAFLGG